MFKFFRLYKYYKNNLYLDDKLTFDVSAAYKGQYYISNDLRVYVSSRTINIIFENKSIVRIFSEMTLEGNVITTIILNDSSKNKSYRLGINNNELLNSIIDVYGQYKIIKIIALSCALNGINNRRNVWILEKVVKLILKRINLQELFR